MWVGEKSGFGKIPWIDDALETELMNTYCLTEVIVNVTVKTAESCARKVIETEKEADFQAYGRVMRAVAVKIRARPQTCVLDVAHFLRHLFLPKEHNKAWAEHRPYGGFYRFTGCAVHRIHFSGWPVLSIIRDQKHLPI